MRKGKVMGKTFGMAMLFLLVGSLLLFPTVAYAFAPDTHLSSADASFIGEGAGDFSGWSVAGAGDVNNDGYDDFLIGARGDEDGGDAAGQTYLILGNPAAPWGMDYDLEVSGADASFCGEAANDCSGSSVASAGDVDVDGCDDFLIGAPYNGEGEIDAGQTYLLLGEPPPAVGGEVYPVNKLAILAPWIVLAVVLVAGISWLAIKRRRAQSQAWDCHGTEVPRNDA